MKFMMIFEGVDRASKVMNKLMRAEKKAAASVKAGAKASASASGKAERATRRQNAALTRMGNVSRRAFRVLADGARMATRATATLHRNTLKLGKFGVGQVKDGLGRVARGAVVASGIAVAAFGSAALAANQFVGTASQFEQFQTVLETTEGSSAKAREAMGWVTDFAARTPYELDQVTESFVQLRAYGLDPTNGMLRVLGDTSAAMGKPMMQAVEAMADAVTGENERLKEFGIKASKTAGMITYEYTNAAGKMATASVKAGDRMAIQATLVEIMGEKYGGAMDKLSGTWKGMVSNIADIWSQFQMAIMNAGLFDWMKDKLRLVLDTLNRMKAEGTFDAWAKSISDNIVFVLETAWQFAKEAWAILKELGGYLKTASEYVGGWKNLAAVLAGIAFAPTLISTAAGIVQIATGLTALGTALLANPVGIAIAAIAGGAYLIYQNWDGISAFFSGLWNGVTAAASGAWEWLKGLFDWSPAEAIRAAWNGIGSAVSAAVDVIPQIVQGVWDGIKTLFGWHPAVLLVENWGGIKSAVGDAVSGAFDLVSEVWAQITALFDWSPVEAIKAAWSGIADTIAGLISGAAEKAGAAWNQVKSLFSFGNDAEASVKITDPATIARAAEATAALQADMERVAAVDTGPAMQRLAALDEAARRIVPAVTSAVRIAQAFLAATSFHAQGVALMDTMAAGIRARAHIVVNEIRKMTQAVRDHLPSSPAKTGPLSDIHRLKFSETIAGSIRPAPMVKAMRAAAAATLAAASVTPATMSASAASMASPPISASSARAEVARVSQRNGGTGGAPAINFQPTIKPTIKIDGKAGEADIEAAVDRALRKSVREMADMLDEEMRRRQRREF